MSVLLQVALLQLVLAGGAERLAGWCSLVVRCSLLMDVLTIRPLASHFYHCRVAILQLVLALTWRMAYVCDAGWLSCSWCLLTWLTVCVQSTSVPVSIRASLPCCFVDVGWPSCSLCWLTWQSGWAFCDPILLHRCEADVSVHPHLASVTAGWQSCSWCLLMWHGGAVL
jgi:hypothetical protein